MTAPLHSAGEKEHVLNMSVIYFQLMIAVKTFQLIFHYGIVMSPIIMLDWNIML